MEILAVLVIAHILITPIVAVVMVRRLSDRIKQLEDQLRSGSPTVVIPDREPQRQVPAPQTPPPVVQPPPEPVSAPLAASVPKAVEEIAPTPVTPPPIPRAEIPRPPPPVPEHISVEPSFANRAVEFLRTIGMVPPSTEGRSRESVIMQWWLPRIGGLLALLTALFFGVYINKSTGPWVKFFELLSTSIGFCALGLFLERKHKGFGPVLLVTGLIMIYVTSVAAYLLPAVKVIHSPVAGAIMQAIAMALIVGVGLKRRSEGIVLLAYHFGFILSIFMAWEGLREGALLAALLLLLSGVVIAHTSKFFKLPWVIIPAVFLLLPAFALIGLFESLEHPHDLSVHIFVNAAIFVVPALYLSGRLQEVVGQRYLVALATSGAISGTIVYFRVFSADALEPATLILGIHFLAWAVVAWRRECYGPITQLLFVKGSFLISAWVVLAYAGDIRWMILALQTLVLAFSARHARRLTIEIAVLVVAACSLYFFLTGGGQLPNALTFLWWIVVLYPGIFLLAAMVMLPGTDGHSEKENITARQAIYLLIPMITCGMWYGIIDGTPHRAFSVASAFVVIMFVTAVPILIPFLSRYLSAAASGLAFAITCLVFWNQPYSHFVIAGLLGWSAGVLFFMGSIKSRASEVAESIIYLLAIPALTAWMLHVLSDWPGSGPAVYSLAALLLFIGCLKPLRYLGFFSLLPPLVFLITVPSEVSGIWIVLAMISGLIWIFLPAVEKSIRQKLGQAKTRNLWSMIAASLLWIYFLSGRGDDFGWITWQLIALIIAGAFLLGAGWFRNPGLFIGGVLFVVGAYVNHLQTILVSEFELGTMPWGWEALSSMTLLVLVLASWHLFAPKPWKSSHARDLSFRETSGTVTALSVFILSLITFQYEGLHWNSYYTPLLAVTAFALIITGLLCRDRPLRYVGLVALLIPLGRLFLVDVQDALHRIIAFGAAAIMLTVLGYLYHVLSKRVEEAVGSPENSDSIPEDADRSEG